MGDGTAIIVCFGSRTECQNCGGHTHAEDGPFPGDDRYCSEDCYADAQEHNGRMARMTSRVTACRSCGLDNFEHLTGCENGSRTPEPDGTEPNKHASERP